MIAWMQPTWLLGRQHQLQPTIAARGSGGRKLPSRGASNLPRIEDLIVARWSSVILVDDQMRVCNLFVDRFQLGPLTVCRANRQDDSHKQITENYQPRSSNSFKSGQIATKQVTHLWAIGSRPTDQMIDQKIGQTRAQIQASPLRLELVRDLDQGLKVWNRLGARSRPRRFWKFRRFRRLI